MTSSAYSSGVFLALVLSVLMATVSVCLSSQSQADPVDQPDLSVHNILPSYRTEGIFVTFGFILIYVIHAVFSIRGAVGLFILAA